MNQLTLAVVPPDAETFASFDVGGNGALLATLRNPEEPMVYLWGEPGSGKTHLLRALCAEAAEQDPTVAENARPIPSPTR